MTEIACAQCDLNTHRTERTTTNLSKSTSSTHNNNARRTKVKFFRSHFSVTDSVLRRLVRYTRAREQLALIELLNKKTGWGRENGGEVRGKHAWK